MTTPQGIAGSEALGRVVGKARDPGTLMLLGGSSAILTEEQAAIVSAPLSPSLVVAGAGSGKTETLSFRFVYLLDHARRLFGRDLSPDEILCLTFTRKAAAEIAARVEGHVNKVFGQDPNRPPPAVSTYNAYAAGLVAEHGLRVGVDPESQVLTEASLWTLAARVAESWEGPLGFDGSLSTAAAAIPSLASALADHGASVEDVVGLLDRIVATIEDLPLAPLRSESKREGLAAPFRSRASLAVLVERFLEAKRASSSLDFSDQIAIASRLADLPAVGALERARYRAVLLDEFQDTSPGQLDLFTRLFGSSHPVMAVGDPHQAIYGFRGASEAALERFGERFGIGDEGRLTLSVSWRNSTEVLRAANAATASLRKGSRVGVPILRSKSEVEGTDEPGRVFPAVSAHLFDGPEAEAAGLVRLVLERRAALEAGRSTGEPIECAILCRARRLFPAIVSALREAGVDHQVVGLGGLLDTPAIVELVALLEVAHDPSRGDSLMRLLTSERIALGIRDLAALGEWAEEQAGPRETREVEPSIVDALDSLPPENWVSQDGRRLSHASRTRLDDLGEVIDAIRRHTHLPLPELVLTVSRLWNLDIEARLAARERGAWGGDEAIYALAEAARVFAVGADRATLGGFLAWLDAAYEREDGLDAPVEEPRKGAIQVQTIHAAKGMEWDVVGIPGLVDEAFPKVDLSGGADNPTYRSAGWLVGAGVLPWPLRRDRGQLPVWEWEKASNLKEFEISQERFREVAGRHSIEEERRLFYVAVTRAKSDVVFTASPGREGGKGRPVSVYLRELADQGVLNKGSLIPPPAEESPEPQARRCAWPAVSPASQVERRALAAEVVAAVGAGASELGEGLPHAREIVGLLEEARNPGSEKVVAEAPTHLSSTDLVRMARSREAYTLSRRRPIPSEPAEVARRGDEFHAWVERYFRTPTLLDVDTDALDEVFPDDEVFLDDGVSTGDTSDARAGTEAGSRAKAPVGLDRLQARFLESEWAGRLPEAVEVDIEMPLGGTILRCRIDAVFPKGGGLDRVTVVDWKTGRPPGDPTERSHREVQLAAYRLAWAARSGLPVDEIDAAFVYVGAGEVARPVRLLGEDEILALIRGARVPRTP